MKVLRAMWLGAVVLVGGAQGWAQGGKTVEVVDPFLKMTAERFAVPAGWSGQGTVLRGVGCGYGLPQTVFRASSPDGLTGFGIMPPVIWWDSESPGAYRTTGTEGCSKLGQTDPTEVALRFAGTRPGARVTSVVKDFDDPIFQVNTRNISAQVAQFSHGNSAVTGREGRVTISYQLNGHAEEEVFIAQDRTQNTPAVLLPKGIELKMGQATMYEHVLIVMAIRTPAGKLAEQTQVLLSEIRKRQQDPQWQQAETGYEQRVLQQNQEAFKKMEAGFKAQSDAEQARFKAQSAATLENSRRSLAQSQAANDQLQPTGQDQIDFLAGNQFYLNPETGKTYTAAAGEGKTYMRDNGTGTSSVVRTKDAYQQMQMPSDWVELKPVGH